jgi:hypothetical protein
MPLTASEQYDANKQKDRSRHEEIARGLQTIANSHWWHLRQHDPVARFTLWLVIVTAVLVIATAVSICVLVKTDETSRLRDRAFVYFADPPPAIPYPADKPTMWGVGINILNAGNMPARKIVVQYDCPDAPVSDKTSDPFRLAKWKTASVGKVIGPKNQFTLQACEVPIEAITSAQWSRDAKGPKEPTKEVFYLVQVTYFDGFSGEMRITQMSRKFRFDPQGGQSLGFVGPHNCSDNDCPKE